MIVAKRDGTLVPWDRTRIVNAVLKALAASREPSPVTPEIMARLVARLVENKLSKRGEDRVGIEEIQDVVEIVLMTDADLPRTAKAYVLYRDQRAKARRNL